MLAVLQVLRGHIAHMPDAAHGPPDPDAVTGLRWAKPLDPRHRPFTQLVFTITSNTYGGAATIAALLMQAHSWRQDPLTFEVVASDGMPYMAQLTCVEVERWAQEQAYTRKYRQIVAASRKKQEAARNRLAITIPHLDGMPTLSFEDVVAILERDFHGASEPFQQPVRSQEGWKIIGLGNMAWCAYAPSHKGEAWPSVLYHPHLDSRVWYTYQLDSKLDKLCKTCHQSVPSACPGYSRACRVTKRVRGMQQSSFDRQLRPVGEYVSLDAIYSTDPRVQSLLHQGPRPKGKGRGRGHK